MKQIVCDKPGILRMVESEAPASQPGTVIIRMKSLGICGTDYHAYTGQQPFFSYPRILGHEMAGEVVDAGGSKELLPGDRVTVVPYFGCHVCIACRSGKPNCCVNIQVAGVHTDGAMQEYYQVPLESVIRANDLDFDQLALVEPLSIAAHAVKRSGLKSGDSVLIMGMGPIGLGIALIAKGIGARVVVVDTDVRRLDLVQQTFGIEECIPVNDHTLEQLSATSSGEFFKVVADATGSKAAIESGLAYLAHGGTYVLVGLQKQAFSFSHPDFHKRETTLMSSRNATHEDFQSVIHLIRNGKINTTNLITRRIAFNDLSGQFEALLAARNEQIKVMIQF